MVVSLKANRKRIIAFLILAAVVVGACLFLRGGGEEPQELQAYPGGTNEERVQFLQGFGWEVNTEPTETREVMIPAEFNDVYTAYNVMQQAQGFELKPYAGEVCTQYRYKINNYDNEPEVYATLLVYGDKIIGGDVASAELDGFMHGFAKGSAYYGETGSGGETAESAPESAGADTSSLPAESSPASAVESGVDSAAAQAEGVESTAGDVLPEDAYPTD